MAKTLDVYLHHELVGHLIQDDGGQMAFDYVEAWLNKPHPTPLSQSLPLRKERFTRKECRAFFAGVLPDENKREIIARNLGISARNDFAMLEQIGGECAGAVTFLPTGQTLPERDYSYRTLSSTELKSDRAVARLIRCSLFSGAGATDATTWRSSVPDRSHRPYAGGRVGGLLRDRSRAGASLASPLTDASLRRVLALYLTFDPPSYRSCMMLAGMRPPLWPPTSDSGAS